MREKDYFIFNKSEFYSNILKEFQGGKCLHTCENCDFQSYYCKFILISRWGNISPPTKENVITRSNRDIE